MRIQNKMCAKSHCKLLGVPAAAAQPPGRLLLLRHVMLCVLCISQRVPKVPIELRPPLPHALLQLWAERPAGRVSARLAACERGWRPRRWTATRAELDRAVLLLHC